MDNNGDTTHSLASYQLWLDGGLLASLGYLWLSPYCTLLGDLELELLVK